MACPMVSGNHTEQDDFRNCHSDCIEDDDAMFVSVYLFRFRHLHFNNSGTDTNDVNGLHTQIDHAIVISAELVW